MFESRILSILETKSCKLSVNDIEKLIKNTNKNILDVNARDRVVIKLSDVYDLKYLESQYESEIISKSGIYKPNMAMKYSGDNNYHIVVYNLNIFLRDNGSLIIPEGVSTINCSIPIRCKRIKFPKSLSSIINLNLKCDGIVNLRNVRFISDFHIDAKELILPYTLERISEKGLTLYGRTIVKTEKTPLNAEVRMGSLGEYAILDKREKKSIINISNRFCNLYNNSILDSVIMFREIELQDYSPINSIFIRNYYPHYLYNTVNDLDNKNIKLNHFR